MHTVVETFFVEDLEKLLALHYFKDLSLTKKQVKELNFLCEQFYKIRAKCGRKNSEYCRRNECFFTSNPDWLRELLGFGDICQLLSENKRVSVLRIQRLTGEKNDLFGRNSGWSKVQGGRCDSN